MRGLRAGALALWLVFVVLTLLGYAMQAELNRDESMYLSAAVCSRDLALYDGFPFPQMPGYPWFTGIFLAGWQSQPLLLIGRLLTATVALSCLLILVLLARRIGAGTWTGIALSTVLLLQPAFLEVAGQASNHLHPLLALAGAILILASDRGRVPAWAFVAGIVAGAAVLFRLTWFVVVAAMALGEFLRSPAGKRNRAVSFGAGVFVALLPAGLAALRAPDAFRFQNFGYHLVNRAWAVDVAGFHTGRDAFWNWMGRWGQSQVGHALLLALLAALLLAIRGRRDWKRKEALAWTTFLLAGLVASWVTSPWWHSHAVPFLGVTVMATLALFARWPRRPAWSNALLAVGVLLALTAHLDRNLRMMRSAPRVSEWVPVRFERELAPLAQVDVHSPVISLSPLHALEAGLAIDPRSVSGPFLVRSRAHMGAAEVRAGRGGSTLLDTDSTGRPRLTGVEPEFEEGLAARLLQAGFRPVVTTGSGVALWMPAEAGAH